MKPQQKPINPTFEPDERQREAIEHFHGPMLVVAGAGTGKTTVLTRRIAYLLRQHQVRPDEILALTYTDNAAREMRERVQSELRGADIAKLQVSTFHGYCNHLLLGCGQNFGVLDDKDLWIYLRKRIRELKLKSFVRAANLGQFLSDLTDFMRRCQDELVGPEKYANYVRRLEAGQLPMPRVGKSKDAGCLDKEEALGRCRELSQVFAIVERMLQEDHLGTFGHMITNAYELLARDPELLEQERARARFILLDEFQDANFAQIKILQKLAGDHRNVFAVGDPDQAIYQFRGASSAAFEIFRLHFPGARLVALGNNRRSTTPILKCAFALISKNPELFAGDSSSRAFSRRSALSSAREEELLRERIPVQSSPVEVVLLAGKASECSDVANTMRQLQRRSGCAWRSFGVLYRQHSHRDHLVQELAEQGIPFSIENMDVIDTPQARDLFACLGAIVSSGDGASLFRVAALPQFAIDPEPLRVAMKGLPRDAGSAGIAAVLHQIEGGAAVLEALQQVREEIQESTAGCAAGLELVIRKFQISRISPAVSAVVDFVGAWEHKPLTKTKSIAEFLEYLDYFRQAGGCIAMPSREDDAVRLMTAHSAKGLEFDHVFILRANSASFPFSYKQALVEFPSQLRDSESVGGNEAKALHEEEERRLFYVAMTRARDTLTIYARQGKGKDTTPAGFLRDLLKNATLGPWLRSRQAKAWQTDLFAPAQAPAVLSRTSQWLSRQGACGSNMKLSATAVESYERCPLQFKLEREWRIPREAAAAMQYGAAMHRVLKLYFDSVRFKRILPKEALMDSFRTDLAEAGIQDHYQRDLYQEQGVRQLLDFLNAGQSSEPLNVLHTEQAFEIRIGELMVLGRIDRIDGDNGSGVTITDYKTGKPRSQEDADESLQLSIYALAAREKWGYRAERLVFHNLDGNTSVISGRSDLDLEAAKLRVQHVAEQIAAGNFNAKPGYHCGFCPYRNLCPATEKQAYTRNSFKPADHMDHAKT
jgi:DNA helicase II / ATP-dependent DNA helicase PcrA